MGGSTSPEMEKKLEDAWLEILKRIPGKELGKFICICKAWYSLILSPVFVASHTLFHFTHHQTHLLRNFTKNSPIKIGKETYRVISDSEKTADETLQTLTHSKFFSPFKTRSGLQFRVVGSVNGVICLTDDYFGNTYTCILWNPLVKKHVKLPKPRINFDVVGPYMHVSGFGYDSRTQDLKVVRIAYIDNELGLEEIPPQAEVYSAKKGVWKWVSADNVTSCISQVNWSQCFLRGSVHWLGYDRRDDLDSAFKNNCLLLFDVEQEKFEKMEMPALLLEVCPFHIQVGESQGLLSVGHFVMGEGRFDMWVQKQYDVKDSWSKVLSVVFEGVNIQKVLQLRKNGEMLAQTVGGELVSYDPNTRNMTSLCNDGFFADYYASSFVESLVFLEQDGDGRRIVLAEADETGRSEDEACPDGTFRLRGRVWILLHQMMKFRREF